LAVNIHRRYEVGTADNDLPQNFPNDKGKVDNIDNARPCRWGLRGLELRIIISLLHAGRSGGNRGVRVVSWKVWEKKTLRTVGQPIAFTRGRHVGMIGEPLQSGFTVASKKTLGGSLSAFAFGITAARIAVAGIAR
jgi:hypothetical protein